MTGKQKVLVKQIAGLIARRIVCYAKPGDTIKAGERYGLIRFGSRVDIFLPKDAELKVKIGDRIKGARDIIGSALKMRKGIYHPSEPYDADEHVPGVLFHRQVVQLRI